MGGGESEQQKQLDQEQQQQINMMEQEKKDQAMAIADEKLSTIQRMQGNGSLFNTSSGLNNTLG